MSQVTLLVVAAAAMLLRPWGGPVWLGPAACAAFGLAVGALAPGDVTGALGSLRDPLLFLVCAVPLAVSLDDVGVFEAAAARFRGGGALPVRLWVLAAAVVVVFNLDAAVVLLTPLYVRVARRQGLDAEALAFQPALLACLASGVLAVSNLTNLIVVERWQLGVVDVLVHLALPSVAATAVGWFAYRRAFDLGAGEADDAAEADPRALRRGLPVVAFVLVGFTAGAAVGVPAWAVAVVAWAWVALGTRVVRWRAIPWAAVVTAGALATLVAAALPHLGLDRVFGGGSGVASDLRVVAFGAIGSNLANNLPITLAGSAAMTRAAQAWPLLVGANVGAVLTITGSLSGLLWQGTAERVGVHVTARRYSTIGVRVGVPALLVATAVVLLTA